MTRDFIVGTVIDAPSTVSVTVLWDVTAVAPANASASRSAAITVLSNGEREWCSLVKAFTMSSIPDQRTEAATASHFRSQDRNEKVYVRQLARP
ncbi:hypothetical protein MDUV_53460 [Mycolicibacterium duvalii]|uniref:Uncharacterized protein n=1 Tax=Mycolicibacterium duvalii TaxID=39688 RepID=A0A7I7K8U1_9MYCO|nr:hypothetical protein MDUV_53460 [Mycolicibacterium duvalii]